MDVSVIFQFLKDLAANNNREWFQGHKDEYLKAQKEFEELLTAIIARISLLTKVLSVFKPRTVHTEFIATRVFPVIRLLIRYTWAAISTLVERNRNIVDIMFI